jgi:hypothetical protein
LRCSRRPQRDAAAFVAVDDWQAELRRQFGREQPFLLENIGSEPVFSEFAGTNPESGGRYRVAIRGSSKGENFCACRFRDQRRKQTSVVAAAALAAQFNVASVKENGARGRRFRRVVQSCYGQCTIAATGAADPDDTLIAKSPLAVVPGGMVDGP